jgi:hypothetical protein
MPLFFVSKIGVMFKYLITLMFRFVFSMLTGDNCDVL